MKTSYIEQNPIYKEAYRACVAAGKNRTKATIMHYKKISKMGCTNPINTEMLIEAAKRDYHSDLSNLKPDYYGDLSYYAKTMFEIQISPTYRKSMNSLKKASKKMYPQTYSSRLKLIHDGKVSLKSNLTMQERLKLLNLTKKSFD